VGYKVNSGALTNMSKTRVYLSYIAANVRKHRHKQRLTQERLAIDAHIDLTYLQRIERGVVNLSVDVLVRLAEVLDLTPNDLLRKSLPVERKSGRPKDS
jgi:transcriptional regulator with XRE-family HTH domain